MRSIQSIVIYTGGSCGDFLKLLCCQQLDSNFGFNVTDRGKMNFDNHYFKEVTDYCFRNKQPLTCLDTTKLNKIENSHFYLDGYRDLADKIFFVDYPNQFAPKIVEIYRKKRSLNDSAALLKNHQALLPELVKKYANKDNIVKILSVLWVNQLKSLRNNPALIPIQLRDVFDKIKLKSICQTVIDQPLADHALFDQTFERWINNNQELAELFSN